MADSQVMRNNSEDVQGWSSNAVEHLRSVHLLLFVVSVGLILITLSAKPYKPAKALTQLEEIQRLQKEWSPEFLYSQITADRLPAVQIGSIGANSDWATIPPSPPYSFQCRNEKTLYECVPDANWSSHIHDPYSPINFPKTISEFREFWSSLQNEQQWIDFMDQVGQGKVLGTQPIKISVAPTIENTWSGSDHLSKDPGAIGQKKLWLERVGGGFEFRNAPNGVAYTWTIPVLTFRRCQIDQKGLTRIVRTWKEGAFDSSFENLAQASQGLEELEFTDLRKQLEAEAGQGSEVFEVAGIKIPSEQLTSAGIVAVLAVQFYFLILLRELFHKLHKKDSGWDVLWIGMFQTTFAQFATWMGGGVCPIAAVAVLAWHGKSQAQSLTARAAYLLALLVSVLLAGSSWRYRPIVVSASSDAAEEQTNTAVL